MRKLLSFLSIALMAMFAFGCEQGVEGGDQSATGTTFTFGDAEISSSTIELSVVPSDLTVNYCAKFFATADIAAKDDATIIDECLNASDFRSRKGAQLVAASGLNPQTSYTVVAFALTESKVTRKEFTTAEAAEMLSPEEFNIDITVSNITATSAVAKAVPNGANRYYFRVITKMELDAFSIYNNDYQIFEYIIENPNSSNWITEGNTTLNCTLAAETDYLAVAFNFENWENMHNKVDDIKLFRHAFKTPKGEPVDPNSLFTTANLVTSSTNFRLDVTPARGEEAHWTYYVWTKKSFNETLANEAEANIVMRSYFGLNNIAVEQGWSFGDIIQTDKLGKVGSNQISAYETLKNASDYVVVLFYVDPTNSDPTAISDYSYVAIPFTTEASATPAAKLEVSDAVIVKDGFGYDIQFLVKTDNYAADLLVGAQLWDNYNFAAYWDPNDWSQIQAFFLFRKSVGAETLAAAKTEQGATISLDAEGKADYVFFFEVLNIENLPTQYAIRVTPEMFDNAQ